ncbi:addiction module component [Mongoliitalea lutea]|uniref:addiction module component n=1 Tax=Mongoliitalea lutea TaxID=849756 RepID=UPI00167AF5AE|nr:addiction module component [Mongoliitalea lutea]
MDIQSVKIDLIHWLTELEDTSILKKLQIIKELEENTLLLSEEQQKELDIRLEKYENGQLEFTFWEIVKTRIKSQIN